MNLKPTILVIEDDISVSNLIATTLETQQYKYILTKNGQDGIHMAVSHNPDILSPIQASSVPSGHLFAHHGHH